jgi:putative oxidoreductase
MDDFRKLVCIVDPRWLMSRLGQLSPLPIRAIVGFGFMEHGYAKLIKNPDHFVAILHALGVPMAHVMAWATIAIELIGGFLILIGAFVPIAAVPMLVVLLAATFTVHLPYGFSSIKLMAVTNGLGQFGPPGYETDLLYMAGLFALLFGGSGPLAVDSRARKRL